MSKTARLTGYSGLRCSRLVLPPTRGAAADRPASPAPLCDPPAYPALGRPARRRSAVWASAAGGSA